MKDKPDAFTNWKGKDNLQIFFPKTFYMRYRQLGSSPLQISEIGFGCMSLIEGDPDNIRLLNHALELGINFFDTADLYQKGNNEIILGKAFRRKREEVIIASKVGNQWRPDGSGWDWNPRKEYILAAIDKSLRRLQTDYIDLYQLHGGTIEDPVDETIEAFELLQKLGKIRYYGISSIRPNVIRSYAERSNIISVMMQYSLLDRRPEETCFSLLQNKKIAILARGTIAQGLLTGKTPKPYLNYTEIEVKAAAEGIASLTDKRRSRAQTAIHFVLQQDVISSAVVGMKNMEQLKEAVQTISTELLEKNEIEFLQNLLRANYYKEHR